MIGIKTIFDKDYNEDWEDNGLRVTGMVVSLAIGIVLLLGLIGSVFMWELVVGATGFRMLFASAVVLFFSIYVKPKKND